MHGGAEGAEGRSDTVTGWRNTLREAAKRLQGCARAARVGETGLCDHVDTFSAVRARESQALILDLSHQHHDLSTLMLLVFG